MPGQCPQPGLDGDNLGSDSLAKPRFGQRPNPGENLAGMFACEIAWINKYSNRLPSTWYRTKRLIFKRQVWNSIFWFEIWQGFQEAGRTFTPHVSGSKPGGGGVGTQYHPV